MQTGPSACPSCIIHSLPRSARNFPSHEGFPHEFGIRLWLRRRPTTAAAIAAAVVVLEVLVEFEFRGLVGQGIHDLGAGKLFPFVNERVGEWFLFF